MPVAPIPNHVDRTSPQAPNENVAIQGLLHLRNESGLGASRSDRPAARHARSAAEPYRRRDHSNPDEQQRAERQRHAAEHFIDQTVALIDAIWAPTTAGIEDRKTSRAPNSAPKKQQAPGPPASAMTRPSQPTVVVPLRVFIWTLLVRSQATNKALQVALCYLNAIRDRIPPPVPIPATTMTIIQPTPCKEFCAPFPSGAAAPIIRDCSKMAIKQEPTEEPLTRPPAPNPFSFRPCIPQLEVNPDRWTLQPSVLPPLSTHDPAPLSSPLEPLRCGRRMFTAALKLAMNYVYDTGPTDRTWVKITGLQLKDIKDSECVLGSALGWDLNLPIRVVKNNLATGVSTNEIGISHL